MIASAECPVCGWREHDVEFIRCRGVFSTVLTCRACGSVSMIEC